MENNAKIDPKRLPVLEAYHQGKTVEEISQNCPGISRATIYNWIKEYKEGKVSRKPRAQTAEKKRLHAAALAFHKEGYSIREIQRAIKLVSYATVRRWVMETSTKNKPPLIKKKQIPLSDKKTAAEIAIYDGMTPEELLVRYRQLLEQNKRQRAQIELAETMIDVAEEEFGIAIRKKSGAK